MSYIGSVALLWLSVRICACCDAPLEHTLGRRSSNKMTRLEQDVSDPIPFLLGLIPTMALGGASSFSRTRPCLQGRRRAAKGIYCSTQRGGTGELTTSLLSKLR